MILICALEIIFNISYYAILSPVVGMITYAYKVYTAVRADQNISISAVNPQMPGRL